MKKVFFIVALFCCNTLMVAQNYDQVGELQPWGPTDGEGWLLLPRDSAQKILKEGLIATGWDANGNVIQCRMFKKIFGTIKDKENNKNWIALSFGPVTSNCKSASSSSWSGAGKWKGKWINTSLNRQGKSNFTVSYDSQNNQVTIHYKSWTTDNQPHWDNGSGVTRIGTLSGNTVSIPVKDTQLRYQFILDSDTKARFINVANQNNTWITITHNLERE